MCYLSSNVILLFPPRWMGTDDRKTNSSTLSLILCRISIYWTQGRVWNLVSGKTHWSSCCCSSWYANGRGTIPLLLQWRCVCCSLALVICCNTSSPFPLQLPQWHSTLPDLNVGYTPRGSAPNMKSLSVFLPSLKRFVWGTRLKRGTGQWETSAGSFLCARIRAFTPQINSKFWYLIIPIWVTSKFFGAADSSAFSFFRVGPRLAFAFSLSSSYE